ncbi:MAG: hypothetical protein LIP03_02980 [Bacteroidales bacterium]|nr:hypothetical protein [Bacteroidales bacterium]
MLYNFAPETVYVTLYDSLMTMDPMVFIDYVKLVKAESLREMRKLGATL